MPVPGPGTQIVQQVVSRPFQRTGVPGVPLGLVGVVTGGATQAPVGGVALSIFIGNIPSSLSEANVKDVLESFGKVQKWIRAVDSLNHPRVSTFLFVVHVFWLLSLISSNGIAITLAIR
jgi:hypothetical protein